MTGVSAEALDAHFGQILRTLSQEAFRLIIDCRIRRPEDLLQVTGTDLRAIGAATAAVIAEVLDARDRLEQVQCQPKLVAAPRRFRGSRRLLRYVTLLKGILPGRHARVMLEEGERIEAVRRDLQNAARLVGRIVRVVETVSPDALVIQVRAVPVPPHPRLDTGSANREARLRYVSPAGRPNDIVPKDSLLRRSILEVFEQTAICRDEVLELGENVRVTDLALGEVEIKLLSQIGVLSDDNLTYVLPLSLEYLIGSPAAPAILAALANWLTQVTLRRDGEVLAPRRALLSQRPILQGIDLASIADLPIDSTIQSCLSDACPGQRIKTWADLAELSEAALIGEFCPNALRAVHQMWQTRERARVLISDERRWLPRAAYASYDDLVASTLTSTLSSDRSRLIVRERLGLNTGVRRTLADLANELAFTREWVRQVEARSLPSFKRGAEFQLGRLWYFLLDLLASSGGVLLIKEASREFSRWWGWSTLPNDAAVGALLSLNRALRILQDNAPRVVLPGHACIECESGRKGIVELVRRNSGSVAIHAIVQQLQQYCSLEKACPTVPRCFSSGFLHHIAHSVDGLVACDDAVYSSDAWQLQHGSRAEAMRAILSLAGHAMHWSEVRDELLSFRPDEDAVGERNVLSSLGRLDDVILWGRGTFIHKAHAALPAELLGEIKGDVLNRLNQAIPFVSVAGLFANYRERLTSAGVPNATALYSCLREVAGPELAAGDYPYLTHKGEEAERPSVAEVLEEYVLDEDGVVTRQQMTDYAVDTLLISPDLAPMHLSNVPGLLRLDRAKYIHSNQLGVVASDLQPLVDHLDLLLDVAGRVSVNKLFRNKRVSCTEQGIISSHLLFSLLETHFSGRYHFRYPTITKCNDGERSELGVSEEVIEYLRRKGTICGLNELTRHFIGDLGYELRNVYAGLNGRQILRYGQGSFLHIDSVAWSQARQEMLERVALLHIDDRVRSGKPFGLVRNLCEYYSLPPLPEWLCWTTSLVGELLSKDAHFRLLGPPKDAFVADANPLGIRTLADLLWVILNSEYNGVARLDVLVPNLISAGVLRKNLTATMLGEDSRVVMRDQLVMAKEVSQLL